MKKIFEVIVRDLFYFFDLLFIKKKYIVFSARGAKSYADNSKYLFEYFISHNDSNAYFFTKDKKALKDIPKNGLYAYSLKGLYILLKSRILVFTHGSGDFYPYFPPRNKNRKFINLFHAIAVKKVGILSDTDLRVKKEIKKWDYFVVSSAFEARFIKEQYKLTKDQLLITGQPRNDVIVNNKTFKSDRQKQKILYAPTFREKSIVKLLPFEDLNLITLDEFLKRNNIEILIKLHINDAKHFSKLKSFDGLMNVRITSPNEISNVNEHLHEFDKLITDYSSIAMDFLLLNRPIGYILYDMKNYEQTRGFSFNFNNFRAGPSINSQRDLENFLRTNSENDNFEEKRSEMIKTFHRYRDGRSSERLYEFIKKL